jgi:hypothetical protein
LLIFGVNSGFSLSPTAYDENSAHHPWKPKNRAITLFTDVSSSLQVIGRSATGSAQMTVSQAAEAIAKIVFLWTSKIRFFEKSPNPCQHWRKRVKTPVFCRFEKIVSSVP